VVVLLPSESVDIRGLVKLGSLFPNEQANVETTKAATANKTESLFDFIPLSFGW
jgi:hypothetical protein